VKTKLTLVVIAVVVAALGLGAVGYALRSGDKARWNPEPTAATASTPPVGPPPTKVRIPSIGVESGLVELHLDANGKLEAPKDYATAGWYADGTRPGDPGPAIIAGHVDTVHGPAVFKRLRDLAAGATVEVTRGDSVVTFKVLAVKRYPKAEFPTDEVYAPTPNAQLRLITCGGAFDQSQRHYVDNVVVYAAAS
jgi:LPXTG-site transpeptidase (sortase) family protein